VGEVERGTLRGVVIFLMLGGGGRSKPKRGLTAVSEENCVTVVMSRLRASATLVTAKSDV